MSQARLFRLNIEVGSLDEAAEFYGALLGQEAGRKWAGGSISMRAG